MTITQQSLVCLPGRLIDVVFIESCDGSTEVTSVVCCGISRNHVFIHTSPLSELWCVTHSASILSDSLVLLRLDVSIAGWLFGVSPSTC